MIQSILTAKYFLTVRRKMDGLVEDALPEPESIELLLTDAKERYKAEQDRSNQMYSRANTYLVVLGLMLSTALRFVDNPPQATDWFKGPAIVLGICIFVGFAGTALSIVGQRVRAAEPTSFWIDKFNTYKRWPHRSLERNYLARLSASVDRQIMVNERRMLWLFRAGLAVYAGVAALLLTVWEQVSQAVAIR